MVPETEKTLAGLCQTAAQVYGDKIALRLFQEGKFCREISFRMLGFRAKQVGLLLSQLGVKPGDRVYLLGDAAEMDVLTKDFETIEYEILTMWKRQAYKYYL